MPAIQFSSSTWRQPMPPPGGASREALLIAVSERVRRRGRQRLRIGVDGLTAAGKTSFGHELAGHVAAAGRPVFRASLDDFKRPWKDRHLYDRESGEGYYRNAFDLPRIRACLLGPAAPNGDGRCSLCGIDPLTQIDHGGDIAVLPQDGVLIVDGVFAFRPELNGAWDLRIWLDIGEELSLARAVRRDGAGGADMAATAEALHHNRYLVAERIYRNEADPIAVADLVIDNRDFATPVLMRG